MRRAKCVASNRITRHGSALSAYYGSVQLLADQGEVEGQPVSVSIREHVDGQLSLTAEPQVTGRPVTSDFTGSLMSSAGIHCRAPASAWPVFSRT